MVELESTAIEDLMVVRPRVFGDSRDFFYEGYPQSYVAHEIASIRQLNISRSIFGTLRGLHYQVRSPQAKLATVIRGEILDVAVDLRSGSPTYGTHHRQFLPDGGERQLYVPAGFAHGFCVLSAEVDFLYQCSDYYAPASEVTIRWNDPDLNIDWLVDEPILSSKGQTGLTARSEHTGSAPASMLSGVPLRALAGPAIFFQFSLYEVSKSRSVLSERMRFLNLSKVQGCES